MSVEIKYYVDAMVLNEAPRMIFREVETENDLVYEYCNEVKSWTENTDLSAKIYGYKSGELADEITEKEALKVINIWKENWVT
jgi:hypothetical protein|tara:strand:+ start:2100 stop:2348 length:249 start_codon:yes stop_codon:yes gene_type:complete